jgi:hypothetical protein
LILNGLSGFFACIFSKKQKGLFPRSENRSFGHELDLPLSVLLAVLLIFYSGQYQIRSAQGAAVAVAV